MVRASLNSSEMTIVLSLLEGDWFGEGLGDFFRICISWEAENELVEAMRRISQCLQGIRPKHSVGGMGIRDLGAE